MKLLLDQGLPRSTVKHLAAAGIVAEHVGDLGLAAAADGAILATVKEKGTRVKEKGTRLIGGESSRVPFDFSWEPTPARFCCVGLQ